MRSTDTDVVDRHGFDRVADVYDATRGGEPRGRAVAEAIEAMLPTDPILEIGVGTGLVATALTQLGRTVLGVDVSALMLAHAHRRLPGRLARTDAAQLPVRDAAVGGFAIVWVLHVVAEPAAVLAEARRVLRPDGRGVVLAPDTGDETPPQTDVAIVLRRMHRALDGGQRRPDHPALLLPLAAAAGLKAAGETTFTAPPRALSPREAVQGIEERQWSMLFDVSPAQWDEVVVPAIAALRALPDQDRPRWEAQVNWAVSLAPD
jgi:SAM-dependent methyltransferase